MPLPIVSPVVHRIYAQRCIKRAETLRRRQHSNEGAVFSNDFPSKQKNICVFFPRCLTRKLTVLGAVNHRHCGVLGAQGLVGGSGLVPESRGENFNPNNYTP